VNLWKFLIDLLLFIKELEHNFQQFRRSFPPRDRVEIRVFVNLSALRDLLSVAPVVQSLPFGERFVWNFHVSILVKEKICKGIDRPAYQSWSDQNKQDAAYRDYIVF